MRTCKRCKTNEAEEGSLNCEKCNERNRKYTAKFIAEIKAKKLHIPAVIKSVCGDCLYYLTCNHESRDKQICDNYDKEPQQTVL